MSFSVQGIAFSKKFASLQELEEEIDLGNIQKVGEDRFENGASYYQMDDRDVYITELLDGTLITLGVRYDIEEITFHNDFEDGKAIRFLVCEPSKLFTFEYLEDGESQRLVFSIEDEIKVDRGLILGAETDQEENDWTGIIFSLIGEITGVNFYNITPDTKSVHYKLQPAKVISMFPRKEEMRDE